MSSAQSLADARAERHARTFTPTLVPYCPHVHRLLGEGYNPHQIAHLTRRPIIDIRLILAGIEEAARKTEETPVRIRRRKRA